MERLSDVTSSFPGSRSLKFPFMLGTCGKTIFYVRQLLQDELVEFGQARLGDVPAMCPGLGLPPVSLFMGKFYLGRGWEKNRWCN